MPKRKFDQAWLIEAEYKRELLENEQKSAEKKKIDAYNAALQSIENYYNSNSAINLYANELNKLNQCIKSGERKVPRILPREIWQKSHAYFNALEEYKAISGLVTKAEKKIERLKKFNEDPISVLYDTNDTTYIMMSQLSEPAKDKLTDIAYTLTKKLHNDEINDAQYANIIHYTAAISSKQSMLYYYKGPFPAGPYEKFLRFIFAISFFETILMFAIGIRFSNEDLIGVETILVVVTSILLITILKYATKRHDLDLSFKLFDLSRSVSVSDEYNLYIKSYDKLFKSLPSNIPARDQMNEKLQYVKEKILPKPGTYLTADEYLQWIDLIDVIYEIVHAKDEDKVTQVCNKYRVYDISLGVHPYHSDTILRKMTYLVSEFDEAKRNALGSDKETKLSKMHV